MKIEEKKLRNWGSFVLFLGIFSLLVFAFRVEEKLDLLNVILLNLTLVFALFGAVLMLLEATKIYIKALQIVKNGGQVTICI